MTKLQKMVMVVIGMTVPVASTCGASLINDGSFETPIVDKSVPKPHPDDYYETFYPDSHIGAWTVIGPGIIALVSGNWYGVLPTKGDQHLAFNAGDQTVGSGIQQSFGTVSGQDYMVSFDVGRCGPRTDVMGLSLQVISSEGTVIGSFYGQTPTDVGYSTYSFVFRATSTFSTLKILDASQSTFSIDAMLDNVSVIAVPEPSTYLAGLSALGMLGLFGWRNRK